MEDYDITIFCWHLVAREPIAEHDDFLSKQADVKYNKKKKQVDANGAGV